MCRGIPKSELGFAQPLCQVWFAQAGQERSCSWFWGACSCWGTWAGRTFGSLGSEKPAQALGWEHSRDKAEFPVQVSVWWELFLKMSFPFRDFGSVKIKQMTHYRSERYLHVWRPKKCPKAAQRSAICLPHPSEVMAYMYMPSYGNLGTDIAGNSVPDNGGRGKVTALPRHRDSFCVVLPFCTVLRGCHNLGFT